MDKILYIIIASAVIIVAGGTLFLMSLSSTGSITDFTDSTEEVECKSQVEEWEDRSDRIDEECIEQLPEDRQEEAMATVVEDEIT